MPQNIKINNVRSLDAKALLDEYYDFMLYKGEAYGAFSPDECLAADFSEFQPDENGRIHALSAWTGASNEGVELNDIGLTGIDNGFIKFRKDMISNYDFMNILTGSTFEINSADTRFFMSPVTGNTLEHCYPMSAVTNDEGKVEYLSFNGGFYQGFYKLHGFDYQTLPNSLENGWTLNFKIRPRSDYQNSECSINYKHPENEGMFFYMGTRAENKFWEFYPNGSALSEEFIVRNAETEGYMGNDCNSGETYDMYTNNVMDGEYLQDELPEKPEPGYFIDGYAASAMTPDCPCIEEVMYRDWKKRQEDCEEYFNDGYFATPEFKGCGCDNVTVGKSVCYQEAVKKKETGCGCGNDKYAPKAENSFPGWYIGVYNYYPEGYCSSSCGCCGKDSPECCVAEGNNYAEVCQCCEDYFIDAYYNEECYHGPRAIEPDFFMDDLTIDKGGDGITDSIGHLFNRTGYFEITTDNKFIFFNRTCTGFTTHNWTEGALVTLTGRTNWSNANYFLLMNRTCTGYTTSTIQQYNEANEKPYDVYKDIKNNAFGLRITPSGAIGYKYGVLDCSEEGGEHHYSVAEEYSKDGMVKYDEWNDITVRIAVLNPAYSTIQKSYKYSFYSGMTVCENKGTTGSHKMKIYVYVNGYLKLVSKELPEFSFRELNDVFQKQEGVPFNISLGGGTQGLMETIGPDYMNPPKYVLPLERDFGGSFNGDIKSFKMFNCLLNYSTIRDYLSKNN